MIKLDDVHFAYRSGDSCVSVLDGVSLSIASGSRIAVTGPSGSGKTSLLLVLTGLEPAERGQVWVDDVSLDSLDADERADLRRDRIGIVFQAFHLIPSLTARENVALPLDIAGQRDGRMRAEEMLARVGLAERFDHYPNALSGGEQQRVAIARALMHEPALVMADEPTGNLDRETGARVADLMFSLSEDHNTTLLLVTHDPELASRCDRQLVLGNGRLQESQE